MDFNKIADTQEYDGNTIDVIFPKKRQTRKRKLPSSAEIGIVLNPVQIESQDSPDSPDQLNKTSTQRTQSQEPFTFTNNNIFRHRDTTSALFQKYFPPEVLKFTDDELQEINELYGRLQEQQQQGRLTQANVNELDKSCLIERFLKDNNNHQPQDSLNGSSQSQSPLFTFDSSSPGGQQDS